MFDNKSITQFYKKNMQATYFNSVMKKTLGLFLMLITGTVMAQTTKTVATINGEKITVVPSGAQTNTLLLTGNTLTSTVNGVPATSAAVSTVSNSISGNNLTTTVNGVVSGNTDLSGGFWSLSGNSNVSPTFGTHFIGTTTNRNFMVKTNNVQRCNFGATGNVDFGLSSSPVNFSIYGQSPTSTLPLLTLRSNDGATNYGIEFRSLKKSTDVYFEIAPINISTSTLRDLSLAPNDGTTFASVFVGGYKVLANSTERLEVNGKVKATGFKIPNGLSTQYLMADGSVSTGGASVDGIQIGTDDKNMTIGACMSKADNDVGLQVLRYDKNQSAKMLSLASCNDTGSKQELSFTRIGDSKFEIQSYNQTFTNGATSPLSLQPKGGDVTIGVNTANSGTAGYRLWVNGAAGGTLAWNTTSDKRLKTNIQPVQNGLSTVLKMNPVSYDKKATLSSTDYTIEEIGFIAQELQPLFSKGVVNEANDKEKLLSVNYTALIPVLTKAIQEQQKIIEDEKAKNDKQQKEIDELKAIVKELMENK
jgi:hypothetical protein